MHKLVLSLPNFGFIVGTRVALAFGLGLLASRRLSDSRRLVLGQTLVAIGALATIPAALSVFRGHQRAIS